MYGPSGASNQKVELNKMFLELDFVGVASKKNTPILTFDFHPRGPRIKKLHETESDWRPILGGSLL